MSNNSRSLRREEKCPEILSNSEKSLENPCKHGKNMQTPQKGSDLITGRQTTTENVTNTSRITQQTVLDPSALLYHEI